MDTSVSMREFVEGCWPILLGSKSDLLSAPHTESCCRCQGSALIGVPTRNVGKWDTRDVTRDIGRDGGGEGSDGGVGK